MKPSSASPAATAAWTWRVLPTASRIAIRGWARR